MSTIFLIHGAYGNSEENWFPWLKNKLKELGQEVIIPSFPTPKGQTLDNWREVFREYESQISDDSIFIGHSLGPAFILSLLEKNNLPIKATFFVSGFISFLDNETFDTINKTFIDKEFDWERIRDNCKEFFMYHSNTDPYVPLEYGQELARKLGVSVHIIKNAGHFNEQSGYKTFELLLGDIKRIL